jgi:hypothetical protein
MPNVQISQLALALRKRCLMRFTRPLEKGWVKGYVLGIGQCFTLVALVSDDIGRVTGIANGRVSLLEITPGAKWDKHPEEYRLREITRVDFGGDYEEALHLVGGPPPQTAM